MKTKKQIKEEIDLLIFLSHESCELGTSEVESRILNLVPDARRIERIIGDGYRSVELFTKKYGWTIPLYTYKENQNLLTK
jgi:hypothetical protein